MYQPRNDEFQPSIDSLLDEASNDGNFWEVMKEFLEGQKGHLALHSDLKRAFESIRTRLGGPVDKEDPRDEHEDHHGIGA